MRSYIQQFQIVYDAIASVIIFKRFNIFLGTVKKSLILNNRRNFACRQPGLIYRLIIQWP